MRPPRPPLLPAPYPIAPGKAGEAGGETASSLSSGTGGSAPEQALMLAESRSTADARRASRKGCNAPCLMPRSEEHTSELQSLMRISYTVFCLKKKKDLKQNIK